MLHGVVGACLWLLRESKRGGATYFLGCAKYPKCKGTREATPELLEQLQEAGAPL